MNEMEIEVLKEHTEALKRHTEALELNTQELKRDAEAKEQLSRDLRVLNSTLNGIFLLPGGSQQSVYGAIQMLSDTLDTFRSSINASVIQAEESASKVKSSVDGAAEVAYKFRGSVDEMEQIVENFSAAVRSFNCNGGCY